MRRPLLSALLLASGFGLAGSAPAADAPRIGFVDVNQVATRSTSVKATVAGAESKLRVKQDEMELLIRDFRRAKEELDARRSVLSESEIKGQESKLTATQDKLDGLKLEIDRELRRATTEVMEPAVERILTKVKEIGKAKGFDLILRSEVVLYGAETLDITPLVIEELDRSAPASPAAAAPKKEEATSKSSGKPAKDGDDDFGKVKSRKK